MNIKTNIRIKLTKAIKNQRGISLIEVVIAIMLLGIIAAGLYTGLGSATNILLRTDMEETAKNLAETQMEHVKRLNFVIGASSYPAAPIPAAQQDHYTASITAIGGAALDPPRDNNIQKIIVEITYSLNGLEMTYPLESYKLK